MTDEDRFKRLAEALQEHESEGIEILTAEPSRFVRAFIWIMVALLLTAFVWSFIGRADQIVSAPGVVSPESEGRRFYAPIGGEIVNIYVSEGTPVSAGDVLARLNAREAVAAAANALEAKLRLSEAQREYELFPQQRKLMEREVEALERKIEAAEQLHEQRVTEGMQKLAESQKAKLEESRASLETTRRERDRAKEELDKLERLFNMPGGGGVSRRMVEDARNAYLDADSGYRLAEARLGELNFLLSREYEQARLELETSDQTLAELRIAYDAAVQNIKREEYRVETQLRSAQLAAEAAARVTFDNIDEERFLRVLAPTSGIVTDVSFTQPGDKVDANTPLGTIAPEDARMMLMIDIRENDRGFLREGLPVKIKFNAFSYQKYGFITGKLEYISPSTKILKDSKTPVYKGRISMDRLYFNVDGVNYPIRYGMTATAEIVVQKKRLIDLAIEGLGLEG